MNGILSTIGAGFSAVPVWVYSGLFGVAITQGINLAFGAKRDRRQKELIKEAVREGILAYREMIAPGKPVTPAEQANIESIANTSAVSALAMASSVFLQGAIIGDCKGCGKHDLLNLKGYCRECQQKLLSPDGGP